MRLPKHRKLLFFNSFKTSAASRPRLGTTLASYTCIRQMCECFHGNRARCLSAFGACEIRPINQFANGTVMKNTTWTKECFAGLLRFSIAGLLAAALVMPANAGSLEQAKRLHDRLAGVPPSAAVLNQMAAAIDAGDTRGRGRSGHGQQELLQRHVEEFRRALDEP